MLPFVRYLRRETSILFKSYVQHNIMHEEYCQESNFVILVCNIFTTTYTIVCIYGPNDDRPSFFDNISKNLSEISTDNVITGGNFNFVTDNIRDSNYSKQNNPAARNSFRKLVEQHNLVDTWRELNPNEDGFTWTRKNPLKYGRLDRIYIPEYLTSYAVQTKIVPGYRSNHSILTLKIKAAAAAVRVVCCCRHCRLSRRRLLSIAAICFARACVSMCPAVFFITAVCW